MIDILEKLIHDNELEICFCKPAGLNYPETYVIRIILLIHICFYFSVV